MSLFSWYTGFWKCSCILQSRWNVGMGCDRYQHDMFVTGFQVQLPGMHVISGCDTVSYPFNKGKISALNILKAGEFTALYEVLGKKMPLMLSWWKRVAASSQPCMVNRKELRWVWLATISTPGRKGNHSGQWRYHLHKQICSFTWIEFTCRWRCGKQPIGKVLLFWT